MKNKFTFLSSILYRPWAVSAEFALNSGVYISSLLDPNLEIYEGHEPEINKPHTISIFQDSVGKNSEGYDKAPSGSIAIIPIVGPLMKQDQFCGPAGMATIGARIKAADEHKNIGAIILKFDTPGGSVDGIKTLSSIIKNTNKPINAFIDGSCFSGGMWLAAHCDKIIASTDIDEVGSIGVMTSFMDVQPVWEQMGVKFHEIYSNLSKDKNKLYREMRNGDYDNYKTEKLDPLAEEFRKVIRENRPGAKDDQLTGKTYFAKDVIGSLVDQIASFDEAIKITAQSTKTINTKKTMKKLKNVSSILIVDDFEVQDGGIFLSETQAEAVELELENMQSQIAAANTERDEIATRLAAANARINDTELENQRLEGVITNLRNQPAAQPAQVVTSSNAVNADADPCVAQENLSFEENIARMNESWGHIVRK